MEKYNVDFEFFWGKINNNENFTFSRYADGEILLMKGKSITKETQAYNMDKWSSPETLTRVGKELLETLNHTENDYYYAISAPTDSVMDYNFLMENIKQDHNKITFVNLWVNSNYNKTIEKYNNLKREVNLICNHNAKIENFPFKVKSITHFPDDCVNFWENNGDKFINDLCIKYEDYKDELFFISCGPISEIVIHHLYLHNPNNSYIDVGSSIDEYVHNHKTRPYMDSNTFYSRMTSNF